MCGREGEREREGEMGGDSMYMYMCLMLGSSLQELLGNNGGRPDLEHFSVPQFLLTLYEHLKTPEEVLKEINIRSLTRSQLVCIIELPLLSLFNCLLLFASWVDAGVYDFSSLPFPLKTHLSYEDRTEVENLPNKWTGSLSDLLAELKQLIEVLKHSEADIMKNINVSSQVSVLQCTLDSMNCLKKKFVTEADYCLPEGVSHVGRRGPASKVHSKDHLTASLCVFQACP